MTIGDSMENIKLNETDIMQIASIVKKAMLGQTELTTTLESIRLNARGCTMCLTVNGRKVDIHVLDAEVK